MLVTNLSPCLSPNTPCMLVNKVYPKNMVRILSGVSRNLERGVQLRVHAVHPKIFRLPRPLPVVNARA